MCVVTCYAAYECICRTLVCNLCSADVLPLHVCVYMCARLMLCDRNIDHRVVKASGQQLLRKNELIWLEILTRNRKQEHELTELQVE
ncbi:uncharacterized protein V6R79_012243 [Siganus canaliculatus]